MGWIPPPVRAKAAVVLLTVEKRSHRMPYFCQLQTTPFYFLPCCTSLIQTSPFVAVYIFFQLFLLEQQAAVKYALLVFGSGKHRSRCKRVTLEEPILSKLNKVSYGSSDYIE